MAMANVAWRGRFDVGNVPRFGYCSAFEVVPKAAIAVVQVQAQAQAEAVAVAEASPNVLVVAIVRFFLPFFCVYWWIWHLTGTLCATEAVRGGRLLHF